MKKLFFIVAILAFAFIAKAKIAQVMGSPMHYKAILDTVHKIKHPTEAMTDTQLNAILSLMQQKANDTEKITVLKAGVIGKGILVAQLTQLLNQFLTDDSKLQCAEYAYPYAVNYKDFRAVEDLFASDAPKGELEDFLTKNK